MASGEMTDAEFVVFLTVMFNVIRARLRSGGVVFACIDWRHVRHVVTAAEAAGFELLNIAVWVKTNAGQGSLYRSQHELIVVAKQSGEAHRNNIELGRHGRSRSNVWEYRGVNVMGPERHLLAKHPTVKPAAMVEDAIRDVSVVGDCVFDAFLGSGTTMIAAQRCGRNCFGIEIEPKFVDLAIRRWEELTGGSAIREADGVSFYDAERAARTLSSAEEGAK